MQRICSWGGENTSNLEHGGHCVQVNVMGGRTKCSVSTDGPNQTQQGQLRPSEQNLQTCCYIAYKSRANERARLIEIAMMMLHSWGVLIPMWIPCIWWSVWKDKKKPELGLKKSELVSISHGETTFTVRLLSEAIAVSCYWLNIFWLYFSSQC